ncbi:allantoin permease [Paenibacillus sp. LMG 31458]|uniref:Allantoin permease n=1 Tax=Paenibacillus phytorum TaxID=2654977 RepID=A0ABX1XQM9_9BACL|nr:cytosine permease [Paenibacillus phytorum]NOU70341.1 allantoin permease [Paenibacillus phytorum]
MSNSRSDIFIPNAERTGSPKELFFIWFAGNIGILGVVMGALIVGYKLSFIQSIMAAVIGALSFGLVGYLSISGLKAGGTTFVLSRAAFGVKGNYIPNLLGWLSLVGWLAVNVVTGTLTLMSLFGIFGLGQSGVLMVISLAVFVLLILASSLFGQNMLVKIQTFFTYVFGALTFLILIILIPKTDWTALLSMSNGDWLGSFLPAISIIVAGTGISWSIAAADYSAYQNPVHSAKKVFASVTVGAFIPLFLIMGVGILLSTSVPDLVSSSNPIEAIGQALPKWMTVLYFITAIGGLIPQCIISLKSARVNLETLNIRVGNATAISIHALIMILIPIYVLFFSEDFLWNFQLFLGILGIGLASWAASFMFDYILLRRKAGYDAALLDHTTGKSLNYNGIFSWLAGIIVGFLFTNSPFFNGPFAKGIFKDSSLGVLMAFAASAIVTIILYQLKSKEEI